ncbi:MAG: NYN domain-containing protein [Parcubacteria group bacterium]|nr:NYN domain-containing protein [Parcubacteria group bacterium]
MNDGQMRTTEKYENNYAFIDSENLYKGIKSLGWHLDYQKFRVYLKHKYHVSKAFLFIGYIPTNTSLYRALQDDGYTLIFKPTIMGDGGKNKGNVDAELVLHTMIEYANYDKAVLVTSDGDFGCLAEYLYGKEKLKVVLSPHHKTCSILLKKTAKEKIVFLDNLEQKLGYKRKSTA